MGDDDDDDGETLSQDVVFQSNNPPPPPQFDDIELYGGFIPRPYAAQWNKTVNSNEKRMLLEDFYQRGYLPPPSNPMNRVLFHKQEKTGRGEMERRRRGFIRCCC